MTKTESASSETGLPGASAETAVKSPAKIASRSSKKTTPGTGRKPRSAAKKEITPEPAENAAEGAVKAPPKNEARNAPSKGKQPRNASRKADAPQEAASTAPETEPSGPLPEKPETKGKGKSPEKPAANRSAGSAARNQNSPESASLSPSISESSAETPQAGQATQAESARRKKPSTGKPSRKARSQKAATPSEAGQAVSARETAEDSPAPVLTGREEIEAADTPLEPDVQAEQGAEAAEGQGEAKKSGRSRRSRSRRNRKKAAAARAAAALAANGEPAGNAALTEEADVAAPDIFAEELDSLQPEDDFRFFAEDELEDAVEDDVEETAEGAKKDEPARNKKGKGKGAAEAQPESRPARRKMFLSVLPGEQLEVVLAEEGQVQEYYVEMLHQSKVKGNIYKGVVHNVDANLQAAFVSYGASKNGFLQIDEVHPEYYLSPHQPDKGRKYPPIQHVLKTGQEILVQVVKEPAGTKGAFLTTYLSLAGRFLVLTPGREQVGVSRKVEDEEERARLRELLNGLTPGAGLGVIVRTVSMGASKTALQRDLQSLKRLWRDIRKKGTTEKAPCLLHEEADLTTRSVRDYLTEDIAEIWVDEEETCAQLAEVVGLLFPRRQNMVQLHKDQAQSLFARFSLQKQIDQVHSREVGLPSGGRLVIDPTEALTAIDINSGRSSGKHNFEDMAYRINMEAAQSIPLQLRLRDIGGQVVIDFIEMRDRSHWRDVERAFRNAMKNDRARHDVGRISSFGLLEVVRQRLGSSAISISTEPCPVCRGTGMRRNMEWQALQAIKDIHRMVHQAQSQNQNKVSYTNSAELVLYLLNHKRERLLEMEKQSGLVLELRPHGM